VLTLKQIYKEAKKRNVVFHDKDKYGWDGDLNYSLSPITTPTGKAFENFCKQTLEDHQQNEEYRQRVWPTSYKPIPAPTKKEMIQWWKEENEDNPLIGFNTENSTFSCAVPEFGDFSFQTTKQGKKTQQHWDLLLQYYVRKSKTSYFKCAVPDQFQWKQLNDALQKVGFEKRAELKSNHGKYKVFVWEYIKK
jgi:hypothetical protein